MARHVLNLTYLVTWASFLLFPEHTRTESVPDASLRVLEDIVTASPKENSHFTIIAHEGEVKNLICSQEAAGHQTAEAIWLKNGVLFDGQVLTFKSMQMGSAPSVRSTLTIKGIRQNDNGIYTCIIINKVGQHTTKTFDLLVTEYHAESDSFISDHSGITAVFIIMIALIVLMAIATALTFYNGVKPTSNEVAKNSAPSDKFLHCWIVNNERRKEMSPILPL